MAIAIITLLTALAGIFLWFLNRRRAPTREDTLSDQKTTNDIAIVNGDSDNLNARLDYLLSHAKNRGDSSRQDPPTT